MRVAFNYRYNPAHSEIRRLLAKGTIGDVGSVHFEWFLDTHHGADYFRRWHRERSQSGGLLVHKSAHHFDLVGLVARRRPGAGDGRGTAAVLRRGRCAGR